MQETNTFKEVVKSPSGKFIPLDYRPEEAAAYYKGQYTLHICAENPYYAKNKNKHQP